MKLWNRASRGQSFCLAPRSPPPFHLSILSFPAHQPASSAVPACQPPRIAPAIPPPAVPLLSSFFINYRSRRAWRLSCGMAPACRPSCSGRRPAHRRPAPFRWLVCPLPTPLSPVSRCGPSAAGGTIGKQRPKMRFPVSFSLLTNK